MATVLKPIILSRTSVTGSIVVVIDRSRSYPSLERNAEVRYARDAPSGLEVLKQLHAGQGWVDLLLMECDPDLIEPAFNWMVELYSLGDLPPVGEVLINSSGPQAAALASILCKWVPVETAEFGELPSSAAA
jgi:hypothetical protein